MNLHWPLQDSCGKICQVAVIEDHWEDGWGDELEIPELDVCWYNKFYGWDKDPYKGEHLPTHEVRVHLAECLYLRRIIRDMSSLFNPRYRECPIEEH